MKNVIKLLGIALAAIIGLGMVSCGADDGGGNGSPIVTINNINSLDKPAQTSIASPVSFQGKENVSKVSPAAAEYGEFVLSYDLASYIGKEITIIMSMDVWIDTPAKIAWQINNQTAAVWGWRDEWEVVAGNKPDDIESMTAAGEWVHLSGSATGTPRIGNNRGNVVYLSGGGHGQLANNAIDIYIANFTMTIFNNGIRIPQPPPEQQPTVERWGSWMAPDSTATITHSVDEEDLCTITVGGTAMPPLNVDGVLSYWNSVWKSNAGYQYTAVAGKTYTYTFEAWTASGERALNVQWYEDDANSQGTGYSWDDGNPPHPPIFKINSERTTYSITGEKPIPRGGILTLEFQCANQLGTFYVKILSIEEADVKSITITGMSGKTGSVRIWVFSDSLFDPSNPMIAGGWADISGNSVTFYLKSASYENGDFIESDPWTGSGAYNLWLWFERDGSAYFYTNGQAWDGGDLGSLPKYDISSTTSTIAFSKFKSDEGGGGGIPAPINPGILTGTISGTITLTDVPNPAPQVYIQVYGHDEEYLNSWHGDGRITLSGSGTLTNVNWSIPIYENNYSHFFPSTGDFSLSVNLGNDREFSISIPAVPYISSANAGGISLGTVSLKYITLSGTINVTYNGQRVPIVSIQTHGGSTSLSSPAANASWSIALPPFSFPIDELFFDVSGYAANYNERLFYRSITTTVNAYDQNVTGIILNIGNISNTPENVTPLAANNWANGEIVNGGDVKWYSINVSSGTKYYLWWNDGYEGDDSKTLDINVYAYNSSNNLISLTDNDSAWNSPVSFTASSSGTVYVRVRAYNEWETGTYAIVYSTNSSRP